MEVAGVGDLVGEDAPVVVAAGHPRCERALDRWPQLLLIIFISEWMEALGLHLFPLGRLSCHVKEVIGEDATMELLTGIVRDLSSMAIKHRLATASMRPQLQGFTVIMSQMMARTVQGVKAMQPATAATAATAIMEAAVAMAMDRKATQLTIPTGRHPARATAAPMVPICPIVVGHRLTAVEITAATGRHLVLHKHTAGVQSATEVMGAEVLLLTDCTDKLVLMTAMVAMLRPKAAMVAMLRPTAAMVRISEEAEASKVMVATVIRGEATEEVGGIADLSKESLVIIFVPIPMCYTLVCASSLARSLISKTAPL